MSRQTRKHVQCFSLEVIWTEKDGEKEREELERGEGKGVELGREKGRDMVTERLRRRNQLYQYGDAELFPDALQRSHIVPRHVWDSSKPFTLCRGLH